MKFGLQKRISAEFLRSSYADEKDQIGNKYGTRPISGIKNIPLFLYYYYPYH